MYLKVPIVASCHFIACELCGCIRVRVCAHARAHCQEKARFSSFCVNRSGVSRCVLWCMNFSAGIDVHMSYAHVYVVGEYLHMQVVSGHEYVSVCVLNSTRRGEWKVLGKDCVRGTVGFSRSCVVVQEHAGLSQPGDRWDSKRTCLYKVKIRP